MRCTVVHLHPVQDPVRYSYQKSVVVVAHACDMPQLTTIAQVSSQSRPIVLVCDQRRVFAVKPTFVAQFAEDHDDLQLLG